MPAEELIHLQVDQDNLRLDQYLARTIPTLSRSHIQKLIRQGNVALSVSLNEPAAPVTRPSHVVHPDEVITVRVPAAVLSPPQPESLPLDIVFEDDDLIVLNKPAGLVVHPAHGHQEGTLVNALLARYPDLAALAIAEDEVANRPGLVHRLDKDTSGLMIVARTPAALSHLRQQFKARTVEKTYLALVFDHPPAPEGVIDVPLGRDPNHRQKFAPQAGGKEARTHYRQLETFTGYSLLQIGLETGRTHQIRVHLAWLKCPVVGDTVYGRKKNALGLKRQFLHAWQLRFKHPRTGQTLALEAPLDAHLDSILNHLRLSRADR